MAKGAVHSTSSNFRRFPVRFNIVEKMRRYVAMRLYKLPDWLEVVERAPPPELGAMKLNTRTIRNPYTSLVKTILLKYPQLRFQDCYVEGNDWSQGNDRYRDDHPVMQFAARQLDLMNQGVPRHIAFRRTEDHFRERRRELEKQQKLMMALAVDQRVDPIFTTGHAYWQSEIADEEARHLLRIRNALRAMRRREAMAHNNQDGSDPEQTQTTDGSSIPVPPLLSPRNHIGRNALRKKAFSTELAGSSLLSGPEGAGDAADPKGAPASGEDEQRQPSRFVKTVSVPLKPEHLKKKSVVYDPLYAGRHGLFLDERRTKPLKAYDERDTEDTTNPGMAPSSDRSQTSGDTEGGTSRMGVKENEQSTANEADSSGPDDEDDYSSFDMRWDDAEH